MSDTKQGANYGKTGIPGAENSGDETAAKNIVRMEKTMRFPLI